MTEEKKLKEKSNFKSNNNNNKIYFPASTLGQMKSSEFEMVYAKFSQIWFQYMKLISFLHS